MEVKDEFCNDIKNLILLSEECSEVIKAVSKVLRFGLLDVYKETTNKQNLEEEIGHAMCLINVLRERGIIDYDKVIEHEENKLAKIRKWYNYNNRNDELKI